MSYKQIIEEQFKGPGTYDLHFVLGGRTWPEVENSIDWDSAEHRIEAQSAEALAYCWETLCNIKDFFIKNNVQLDSLYLLELIEPVLKTYTIEYIETATRTVAVEARSEEEALERFGKWLNGCDLMHKADVIGRWTFVEGPTRSNEKLTDEEYQRLFC